MSQGEFIPRTHLTSPDFILAELGGYEATQFAVAATNQNNYNEVGRSGNMFASSFGLLCRPLWSIKTRAVGDIVQFWFN